MKNLTLTFTALLALSTVSAFAGPLREPSVTVYVATQDGLDACNNYYGELFSSSVVSTRDTVFAEIKADSKLSSLVDAAKAAAKDKAVKELVAEMEKIRPDLNGKVVFTVGKYDSYGRGGNYGVRVSLTSSGSTFDSIPTFYTKCEGTNYRYSTYSFEGAKFNSADLDAKANGDIFKNSYEYLDEGSVQKGIQEIIERLKQIEMRIPMIDGDLS